jgi:transcriptional regulator with XRE-family HTH domain
MDDLRTIFGRRVRAFREGRGWSQEQLGKAAGLGGKYIGIIERGEKNASFEAIERLAEALGVECYELFVPTTRRTDSVERHVKTLTADSGRIDLGNVNEFLRALAVAVRKLDRQSKPS